MTVVITKNPAYWAPGLLVLPDGDGTLAFEFRARFKRLPASRQRDILDRLERSRVETSQGRPPLIKDDELLAEVLCDWEGFRDADGKPVPYAPASFKQACEDYFGLEAAFARAYVKSAWPEQQRKEAEKN